MKIATYNLWNSDTQQTARLSAACEELTRLSADMVALQEVPTAVDGLDVARYLGEQCGYRDVVMRPYPDEPSEGLAFLSKHALSLVEAGWDTPFEALENCGLRCRVNVDGTHIAVTNVHFAWRNIAVREAQVQGIVAWIESQLRPDHYELLCGDFNCTPNSSVYRYLMGQQTLGGIGVTPWHDLAHYHAERIGTVPAPTLDFWSNPRWRDAPTLEIPMRVDWILLRDVFAQRIPFPTLKDAGVFGTNPSSENGLVPSDHYGVYADLDFRRQRSAGTPQQQS